MTQQSNTLNFVIHDVNGQPQVIKVVQSPTANKHSQLTGQTVKAIIKTPSHDNQTNVLQGSGQVIRTLTLQPQKNTSGQRVLTIPIGSAGGPQSNTNLKVQTIKAGEHHTILPKTLHLASSSLVLGSGQRLTSSPSVITTSGTGSATPRITSVTSATQSNLTTVATANLNSNNSNNNNSSIINNTNSFISPILDHTGGSRKRHDIEADYVPEYTSIKRRKTEKVGKGLRHFSMKVCEKVRKKGTTSYNEVADELVQEFTNPLSAGSPTDQQYDQKNIRRRVYDALNVLMAMNIISKEKKEIRWLGLPTNSLQECKNLEKDCQKRVESIKHKTQQLQDLIVQQISFKNLVERNRSREKEMGSSPMPNSTIQLPFIIVNTNKKTVIDCSIANDKTEYQFNFNDKFEIHDDIEVLKRMGMDFGLDKGECTYEDLQKAKSMVPKSLEHYVEQLAHGSIDILPAGFELSTGVSEPSCSSTSGMNMTMTVEEVEATLTHNDVSRQSSHTSLSDPLSPSIHEFSEEEEEDDSDLSSELEVN